MGMSFSKNKSRSGPTGGTERNQKEIWRASQDAANAGVPGSVSQAGGYYGSGMTAGQTGLDALSGNADATQRLMNPYQQQVVDKMNEQFQFQNTQTANQMNDAATRAGAFGGSRHGVATGVALGENQRNQGMQMAGLLQGGFDQTMNRAGQLAGYGMDAAGQGSNLGMVAGNPQLWRQNVLQRGYNPLQRSTSSGWGLSASGTGRPGSTG
jgi:hypothetical protein